MSRLKVYDYASGTWQYAGGVDPNVLATDAAFSSRYASVNLGAKAYSTTAVAQNSVGATPTVISNLAASVTAIAGRLYKISYNFAVRQRSVANGNVSIDFYETGVGTGTILHWVYEKIPVVDDYKVFTGSFIHVPAAGIRTYRARISTTVGTVDLHALGAPSLGLIMVEDIGLA